MTSLGRGVDPVHILGTAENAAYYTEGRHPGVQTALAWLAFSHLPEPIRDVARPFYQSALELLAMIREDSAELTTALNRLVEAKDWAVRAKIRAEQGKPGPAPRPAEVVDPPKFGRAQIPARPDQQLPEPRAPRPIKDNPQA